MAIGSVWDSRTGGSEHKMLQLVSKWRGWSGHREAVVAESLGSGQASSTWLEVWQDCDWLGKEYAMMLRVWWLESEWILAGKISNLHWKERYNKNPVRSPFEWTSRLRKRSRSGWGALCWLNKNTRMKMGRKRIYGVREKTGPLTAYNKTCIAATEILPEE